MYFSSLYGAVELHCSRCFDLTSINGIKSQPTSQTKPILSYYDEQMGESVTSLMEHQHTTCYSVSYKNYKKDE